ncbi:ASICN [Lepeophtheirus salmonis]|uniref:ASICN n=1 Tax=Lepeophtheirus salmonis TaxID=72036 RepID=A0A7R8CJ67_LEPSM|nr:ASICN [Lepeophtheirus salmonis]CAF2839332.1 ASICN [Lepeophtheirus salmonis]
MFRKSNKVGVKVAKEGGSRANFKTEKLEEDYGKWKNPFIDLSSSAIAIRFKELDQCCFANVSCVSIIKEYCESSSLHGLRYITEDGRHWTERVLWVFLCLLGFILTVYFIIPIYIKWYLKPTLTTLDSTNHPIWKIDFPGDQEPWKSEIATNGISLQEIKRLIEIMVHFDDYETVNSEYSDLQGVFERVGQGNLTNLMVHVMSTCDEYILKCWWKGQLIDCKEIFEIRKTDNGFCCSFNTIQPTDALDTSLLRNNENINDDWISQYYDHGEEENTTLSDLEYLFKEDESALPQIVPNFFYDYYTALTSDLKGTKQWNNLINRQNSASPERGLSILLDSKSKDYFVSSDNFIGFKILVHDPQSYPEVKGRSLIIGPGKESFMTIAASHTEGSDSIRKLPIERRNCLFSDERKVKESKVNFFKDYSQENCYLECRAKHLLQNQKEYEHLNSTCDWNGWNCLANSTQLLEAIDPNFHISKTSWDDGAPCNCPPACTRTDYSATQSSADLNPKAELKIFKYSTDELFSWNDILAAFGGLVGLCTGFSFLSLAELVYFFHTTSCFTVLPEEKDG